jgi:3-dehydro-L-gulonate 2-dehydrogenase
MRITYQELLETFEAILVRRGMAQARACAALFADTTRDGVATHGVNRFPVFVGQIDQGDIRVNARPVLVQAMGAFERWDGQFGPGNLNAVICMDRAIELARGSGVGVVALRDTNHWMRGGTYGLRAAAANCIGICWTNAVAAMPAWGGQDARLGNNPLILALPGDPPVLVDMAMSQFSYGKLQEYRLRGQRLPVAGGYDRDGALTDDPAAVEATRRVLPAGYWKGSALSMALDMIAAALSGGNSVADLSARFPRETGVSQVFIAFAMDRLDRGWEATVARIKADVRASAPAQAGSAARIPGERAALRRADNDRDGIEVDQRIWAFVRQL